MGEKNWEVHERECFRYLKETFSQEANFAQGGGSDSTIADIQVQPKNGRPSFWIESKSPQSQSGQFVVKPINGKFYFSDRNKTAYNSVAEFIIHVMNRNFEKYNNAGTAGVNLNINSEIFARWIKDMYSSKDVKYFITHSKSGKYVILPIDRFSDYYDIAATFRVKKSGSGNVAKSVQEALAESIIKSMNASELQFTYGVKMRVNSSAIQDKQKFEFDGREYMFSKAGDGEYVVRRLSNTNNLNVIFSISLKNESGISEEKFKEMLKK